MDITPIAKLMILLVFAAISALCIPYIRSKTNAEQQAVILSLVRVAVAAAEQIFNGPGRGSEKKSYVTNWLAARGITLNTDELDAMIESEVYRLKEVSL